MLFITSIIKKYLRDLNIYPRITNYYKVIKVVKVVCITQEENNLLSQDVKDECLKEYREKTKKEIDLQIDANNYLPEDW